MIRYRPPAIARLAAALVLAALVGLLFTGCGKREGGGPNPGPDPKSDTSSLIDYIALGATGIAALVLVLIPAAFIFGAFIPGGAILKRYAGPIALAAIATIVAAQLLVWLAAALWWIALVAGILGVVVAIAWAWKRRNAIERFTGLDIDRDGDVGK